MVKQLKATTAAGGNVWTPRGDYKSTPPTTVAKRKRTSWMKATYRKPFFGFGLIALGLAVYVVSLALGVTGLSVGDSWTKTVTTFTTHSHTGHVSGWWVFSGMIMILTGFFFVTFSHFDRYDLVFVILLTLGAAAVLGMTTAIIGVSCVPDTDNAATDWVKEQVGTDAKIPDTFSLDTTYSYHVYGPQTGNWTVKVTRGHSETVATLQKDSSPK